MECTTAVSPAHCEYQDQMHGFPLHDSSSSESKRTLGANCSPLCDDQKHLPLKKRKLIQPYSEESPTVLDLNKDVNNNCDSCGKSVDELDVLRGIVSRKGSFSSEFMDNDSQHGPFTPPAPFQVFDNNSNNWIPGSGSPTPLYTSNMGNIRIPATSVPVTIPPLIPMTIQKTNKVQFTTVSGSNLESKASASEPGSALPTESSVFVQQERKLNSTVLQSNSGAPQIVYIITPAALGKLQFAGAKFTPNVNNFR